jgi:hypothetical protein
MFVTETPVCERGGQHCKEIIRSMASIYFKLDFTFHEASVAPSGLAQQPRQLRLNLAITEKTQILPTQVPFSGSVEIWSVEYGFVGSQQAFSNQAINLAEQMMKRLVNDWTASQ